MNCSNYEQSRLFYELFGFQSVNDFEENSPEVAKALGVSSYKVRGSYMTLNSKSIIEIVDWEEPYDSEPPYPYLYHIDADVIRYERGILSLLSDHKA